jgi:hypothetical protein
MGKQGGMDCIFCSIVKETAPSWRVYEDEVAVAFLDVACDPRSHVGRAEATCARHLVSDRGRSRSRHAVRSPVMESAVSGVARCWSRP